MVGKWSEQCKVVEISQKVSSTVLFAMDSTSVNTF
jgi:hypothetical protein